MRRFKSPGQAQRFLSFHGLVNNLCRQQQYLLSAPHYRTLRNRVFGIWEKATARVNDNVGVSTYLRSAKLM